MTTQKDKGSREKNKNKNQTQTQKTKEIQVKRDCFSRTNKKSIIKNCNFI